MKKKENNKNIAPIFINRMYYSDYYILTIKCTCFVYVKKRRERKQDAMPQNKNKRNQFGSFKEGKNNIAHKIKRLKKDTHVDIRLTRRMIILYPLSWSQRKYNNSDM